MDLVFKVSGIEVPQGMRPDSIQPKEQSGTGVSLNSKPVGFSLAQEVWLTWEFLPFSVFEWWENNVFQGKKVIEASNVIFPNFRGQSFTVGSRVIRGHAKWDKASVETFTLNSDFEILNDDLVHVGASSIKIRELIE